MISSIVPKKEEIGRDKCIYTEEYIYICSVCLCFISDLILSRALKCFVLVWIASFKMFIIPKSFFFVSMSTIPEKKYLN